MKKFFLNLMITTLLATSIQSSFAENSVSTYQGKASIALDYFGTGWNDGQTPYLCDTDGRLFVWTIGLVFTAGIWPVVVQPMLCIDYDVKKSTTIKTKLELIMKEVGNNRVTLSLSSEDKKGCGGFTIAVVGEGDGFGNYELFRNNDDYVANKLAGRLMIADNIASISIEPSQALTKGKLGNTCSWNMENGLKAQLKVKKIED
ncbi:MAG: hypothetical protein AB7I27_04115 [Bacteriovoracaceae bacterium]